MILPGRPKRSYRSAQHEGGPENAIARPPEVAATFAGSGGAAALLDVQDLHAGYGKIDVLTGISLCVSPGEIVTVIGPNGAGKSTLLAALMGVLPSRGGLRFDGERRSGRPIERRVAAGMALVPETRALFSSMSVEDNLELGSYRFHREPRQLRRESLEGVYALFPRLRERRRQEASTLSGGERQMLAVGRALMGRPRLLMLDEPSLGLAPLIVRDLFRIIGDLRHQGVAVLLVEQNARAALALADRAYVLELGAITVSGPARAVAADPRVVEAYLGLESRHQNLLNS